MKKVCSKRRNTLVFILFLLGSMATQCLGTLVYPLPADQKKGVRELEKVSLKLAKSDCSVLFNGVCLSENILPIYTNIYIAGLVKFWASSLIFPLLALFI